MDWSLIFAPSIPLLEGFIRGTAIYLALLILMRIVGQRESGGLGISDVLLVVLVAQAAGPGLNGDGDSVTDGLVLIVTMLFWSTVVDALAYRFPRLASVMKASTRLLIKNGTLNRKVMLREFMTYEEIQSQLRLHGIENIAEVDRAYIEPNGMISIIRTDREETEPVEPPDSH